jgi:serine protease inhibitor
MNSLGRKIQMAQKNEYLSNYKKLRSDALDRIVDICNRVGKPLDKDFEDSLWIKVDWPKLNKLLDEERSYYDEHKRINYIGVENNKAWFSEGFSGRSNAAYINDNLLFAVCDYLNSKRGA